MDARPIQRPDGTAVATDSAGLLGAADLLDFIDQLANGTYTTAYGAVLWTGAQTPMLAGTAGSTCNSWIDLTGSSSAQAGTSDSASRQHLWTGIGASCNSAGVVLCLEM